MNPTSCCNNSDNCEDNNRKHNINFLKHLFLNCVCGLEYLNNRYDCGLKLNDWSHDVASHMEDYRPVIEEIYDKYEHVINSRVPMNPATRLACMLLNSACTFHLSQSLFPTVNNGNILEKMCGRLFSPLSPLSSSESAQTPDPNLFSRPSSFQTGFDLNKTYEEPPEALRNLLPKMPTRNL